MFEIKELLLLLLLLCHEIHQQTNTTRFQVWTFEAKK